MSPLRRFEAACGLLTIFIGLVILIIIFLGLPFHYQTISSSGTGSTVNAFPAGVQLLVFVVFGLLLLGLVSEGIGATLHSRTGGNRWRVLLWVWGCDHGRNSCFHPPEYWSVLPSSYTVCVVGMRTLSWHKKNSTYRYRQG
jgi:uncharacterized integral membrane protein